VNGAYVYAMMAIPSSLQVAITKPMNIDELPWSGQARNVWSMLTIFGLLLVCLKAYFNLDRSDRHNLIRTISTRARIGNRAEERLRTLCARRIVSAPTSDRPM
jgi:hypothetical protein